MSHRFHHRRLVLPALACAAAVVAAVPAAAAPARQLTTRGSLVDFSVDGSKVAVAVHSDSGTCPDRVYVWNVATGGTVRLGRDGGATCPRGDRPRGGITAIALGGDRAVWTTAFGGNTEFTDTLITASLQDRREHVVGTARANPDSGTGTHLGGLAADAGLRVFSRWVQSGSGAISSGTLSRFTTGAHTARLRSGQDAVVSRSADSGRVAVLAGDGTVGVYAASGHLVRGFTPLAPRAIALRRDRLVVLTGDRTLRVYDTGSGALVHTWPVASGTHAELDAYGGYAVYTTWRAVHALRLVDGKDRVVATTPRAVSAEIDAPGVVYGYTTFRAGHFAGVLRVVPMARIRSLLG